MSTFLPSKILLPSKTSYVFDFEEVMVNIAIVKHFKSLIINDYDNKLIEKENGIELRTSTIQFSNKTLTSTNIPTEGADFALDFDKHYRKEAYFKDYTEILLRFESDMATQNFEIAVKALTYFMRGYRITSDDLIGLSYDKATYFANVMKDAFHIYTNEELALDRNTRTSVARDIRFQLRKFTLPFWNLQGGTFKHDLEKNALVFTKYLSSKRTENILHDYLLKAREEFYVNTNYKYSFLESWSMLEIGIVRFVTERKLLKGISKNKIKDFEKDIGISYQLNVELLLLVDEPNNEELKQLITSIDNIRKLRNKVIHAGQSITKEQALNGIDVSVKFLNFMKVPKY